MNTTVSPFNQLINPQIKAVEALFAQTLHSDLPDVEELVSHVGRFRGKMLRPTLVLLSGLTANNAATLGIEHITLATVVEMVHMATLVHDDILDEAEVRRRGATINHLRGNEAAVLLGDYLISHAFHLCSSLQSTHYGRIIGHATNVLCEGELTQNFNRNNWNLDEKTYYSIIYRKTAILTEACCRLGAMLSTDDKPAIETLAAFGKHLGMAFQIIDDILDIAGDQKTVGKSLGTDIEKGKLTLPMIHFLKTAAPQHKSLLISLLESHDHDRVERVRQLIAPTDSIAYALNQAENLVQRAIAALQSLPPTPARQTMVEVAHFVTARDL